MTFRPVGFFGSCSTHADTHTHIYKLYCFDSIGLFCEVSLFLFVGVSFFFF